MNCAACKRLRANKLGDICLDCAETASVVQAVNDECGELKPAKKRRCKKCSVIMVGRYNSCKNCLRRLPSETLSYPCTIKMNRY